MRDGRGELGPSLRLGRRSQGLHKFRPEPSGFVDWIFDPWGKRRPLASALNAGIALVVVLGGVALVAAAVLFMLAVSGQGP